MPGLENGLELAGTSGSRELDQSDVTPMALVAGPKQRLPWEDRDDSMSPSQFTENSSMHRIHSCVHRDASVVRQSPYRVLVAASLLTAMAGTRASAQRTPDSTSANAGRQSRVVLTHALPPADGARLKATVVEVNYAPGASSAAHSHPCPVVGYVVRGTLRMKFNEEPEAIYKAGESFYEAPDGVHRVSANASDTEPATLIAYFTCDRETTLSVPVPSPRPAGRKP